MAGGAGRPEADLSRRVLEEAHAFEFYQLVHVLHRWLGGVPLGEGGPFQDERLRLRPHASLTFSAADVQQVRRLEGGRLEVMVNFMGLYGVAASTPVYFTELVCFSDVDAEPLTDFLDLLNHRLTSLIYRSWLKYRFPFRFQGGARDRISVAGRSFVGFDDDRVCARAEQQPGTILRYLGLLCLATRPPVALELALGDATGGLPVAVREWMPRWVTVPPEQRNRVGLGNTRLGRDLTVGDRVLDRSGKCRIEIGPVGYAELLRFLPDGAAFADLWSLTKVFTEGRVEHDVQLEVRGAEIPPLRVGSDSPARLGWTSWVGSGEGLRYDPKVVFSGPVQ